ncbi:MAG: hypothetical protein C0621_09890 [Desulfuromonas sp.]|nr:MAG: hypothetical protein C0621_09890 [Desulfuromonas sp.]
MTRPSYFRAAWQLNPWVPLCLFILIVGNIFLYLYMTHVVTPEVAVKERRFIEAQAQSRQIRRDEQVSPVEYLTGQEKVLQQFYDEIPPYAEFTELVGEIFDLARQAGLTVTQVRYDPKPGEGNLLRYGLDFSVTGNYAALKQFVASFEQSPRVLSLDEMNLSDSTGPGVVQLRLRLTTYFRAEAV